MPSRYLQQELGLDPMTAEEAQRPPIKFPITPGAYGGQLREDIRREFIPSPEDTEEQSIYKAIKLFGTLIGSRSPATPSPGTAGILAAVGRVRPPHRVPYDLAEARQMEVSGYHPQEIWDRLGVARGADRSWREEMPGGAADPETLDALRRVVNKMSRPPFGIAVPLGSVASKEFAAAYPELMKGGLTIRPQNPAGISRGRSFSGEGGFSPETGKIFLSPGGELNLPKMLEHEAQHGVQNLHGWNTGGSPFISSSTERLPVLPPEVLAKIIRFARREGIPQDIAYEALGEPAFRNYMKEAGETEARNAWRRLQDPSLRRLVPSQTEDIPREYQTVTLPKNFTPPEDDYAGIWRSPLYESGRSLLPWQERARAGTPRLEDNVYRVPTVTQEWKPDEDQLKQIRRVQKWLKLVEDATKGGK